MTVESIRVIHKPDNEADMSYLGTFSDKLGEFAIYHSDDGGRFKYFNPQPGTVESEEEARAVYDRMVRFETGDLYNVGIYASALVIFSNGVAQEITSGGVYGIESDTSEEDIASIEIEQLDELYEMLKEMGLNPQDFPEPKIPLTL